MFETSTALESPDQIVVKIACPCGEPCCDDQRFTIHPDRPVGPEAKRLLWECVDAFAAEHPAYVCAACGEKSTPGVRDAAGERRIIAEWTRPEYVV
jgi:hypothetical protein